MGRIRITQSRSEIGHAAPLRRTLRALGLRGYQRTVEHEDTPQIRGMIRRVSHLVTVAGTDARDVPRKARSSAGREAPRSGRTRAASGRTADETKTEGTS